MRVVCSSRELFDLHPLGTWGRHQTRITLKEVHLRPLESPVRQEAKLNICVEVFISGSLHLEKVMVVGDPNAKLGYLVKVPT